MAQNKAAKPTPGCIETCPLVGVLIAYFEDEFGNDSRPQVLCDLRNIKEGKPLDRPKPSKKEEPETKKE